MRSSHLPIVAAVAFLACCRAVSAGDLSYNELIRPILVENCFGCHGVCNRKRSLSLRYAAGTARRRPIQTAIPSRPQLVDALVELVNKAGGREVIRERLLEKARAEAPRVATHQDPPELHRLHKRLAEPNDDIATAERRMSTEKDDARHAAIARTFDSLIAEKSGTQQRIAELSAPKEEPNPAPKPEQQVDALMATIDDLASLAGDANSNQRIRELSCASESSSGSSSRSGCGASDPSARSARA